MKSLARILRAGLVALNAFVSAGVSEAADSGLSSDPVAFFCGPLVVGDSDASGVLSLAKSAMTPSGNPLLAVAPRKFTWTRKAGGVTRYKLTLALLNKNTGQYAILCKGWIPQPASGPPAWKPPVHAMITGGQYRWTITPFAGTTRGMTSMAFFKIQKEKGTYIVIDLAGGPDALAYSVTYLNAITPGGWTDEYKTTKLVLRKIPAGSFTRGSPINELGRDSGETQHTVMLTNGFYMGVFEVTQRQWELVMGNRPSYFSHATYYASRPVEWVTYYEIRENPLPIIGDWERGSAISPNWPQSSQVHADSFMGRLRAKTGLATLDLPTEAQWEYACRAGTATALNSRHVLTNDYSDAHMAAVGRYVFNGGSEFSQGCEPSAGTATVGSYQPNAWGLYDMHGNVSEWCLDWLGPYPATVSNPPGAASGSIRVGRGGSWSDYTRNCRSACRASYYPSGRSDSFGFRLAGPLP